MDAKEYSQIEKIFMDNEKCISDECAPNQVDFFRINGVREGAERISTQATQRTLRFIRWVLIYQRVPWREAVARVRKLWSIGIRFFHADHLK